MFFPRWRRAPRTVIVSIAAAVLLSSACTDDRVEGDGDPLVTATTFPEWVGAAERQVDPALAGSSSVAASWTPLESFRAGLITTDPGATDLAAAAAGYDAVIIAALSAESARSDAPGKIAAGLPATTTSGTACGDFAHCRSFALTESDFDYDGISGPLALDPLGTPTQGDFVVETVAPSGRVTAGEPVGGQLRDVEGVASPTDPRFGPTADGTLKIGTILPSDAGDSVQLRSARAGVRLAVEQINDPIIGGALGKPLELLTDTSGGGSPDELSAAASALIGEGADVVIGATDEASAALLLPILSDAGIPLISPVDPTPEAVLNDSAGLYFRTAATVELTGRVIGQQASYNGVTTAVVVTGPAGADAASSAAAIAALGELDGTVAAEVPLADGNDLAGVSEMIAAAEPTAIIVSASATDATALAGELTRRGVGPSDIMWFVAPRVLGR